MSEVYVLTYQANEYERMADEIREVQRGLAEIAETAESDDGRVAATVDARGEVVELRLDPRVYRNPDSSALSAEIVRTCRAARAAAEQKAFDATAALLRREG